MEARFRHWIKKQKQGCDFLTIASYKVWVVRQNSQFWLFFSEFRDINSQLRVKV